MRLLAPLLAFLLLFGACASSPRRAPDAPASSGASAPFAAPGAPRAGTVPSLDGLPIAYALAGSGSPALLFVHGWSCDRSFWEAQMRSLAPRHQVVAIDLPGHGESGTHRQDWTVPAFGADVVRVMEALELRDVVLVGHSMGGSVALDAAARAPERVSAVVGVDTLHDVEGDRGLDELTASLERDFEASCRAFVGSIFGAAAEPATVASVQERVCDAQPEIALAVLRGLRHWDDARGLAAVKVPVRCIQGDRFPTNLEGNRRHHADFDVIVLPGTGHFPQLESPEDFERALAEVLASLRR